MKRTRQFFENRPPLTDAQKAAATRYYNLAVGLGARYARRNDLECDECVSEACRGLLAGVADYPGDDADDKHRFCYLRRTIRWYLSKFRRGLEVDALRQVTCDVVLADRHDDLAVADALDAFEGLVGRLHPRQAGLLRALYRDDHTASAAARETGMGRNNVVRVERQALRSLRLRLIKEQA